MPSRQKRKDYPASFDDSRRRRFDVRLDEPLLDQLKRLKRLTRTSSSSAIFRCLDDVIAHDPRSPHDRGDALRIGIAEWEESGKQPKRLSACLKPEELEARRLAKRGRQPAAKRGRQPKAPHVGQRPVAYTEAYDYLVRIGDMIEQFKVAVDQLPTEAYATDAYDYLVAIGNMIEQFRVDVLPVLPRGTR